MKSLILVLTCLTVLMLSLPSVAGPLTGAPAIRFEVGGAPTGEPGAGSWALGVGYTTFNFKLAAGTTEVSATNSGPIVSAEYTKPLSEGKSLAFGGWISPTGGDLDDLTMGEVHGRYSFTPNWGIELGRLLFDAGGEGGLGQFMLHAVYQSGAASEKAIKWQVGLGVVQGAYDEPGVAKIGTGGSFFANASYPFSDSWSGYASVWSLFQQMEWDASTGIGDSSFSTIQWSIGASHAY